MHTSVAPIVLLSKRKYANTIVIDIRRFYPRLFRISRDFTVKKIERFSEAVHREMWAGK